MGAIWVNRAGQQADDLLHGQDSRGADQATQEVLVQGILGDDAHQEAGQRHAEDQQAAAARVGQRPEQPHRQSKAGAGKGPSSTATAETARGRRVGVIPSRG